MADLVVPSAVTEATNESWKFQQTYIERLMDHSALSSAHPDDTLILAGPPRYIASEPQIQFAKMLPLGVVQQMDVGQNLPTTPMQAIGSGRSFATSGKAQSTARVVRLFVNGRNLLRALYTNLVQAGIDPTKFDDLGAISQNAQFWANLDSELFKIPFGMAVIFRDKIHNEVGAFYLELCYITAWAVSIAAGQTMIAENVNMWFDRLKPISAGNLGLSETSNYSPTDPAGSALFQSIFQKEGNIVASPGIDER